MSVGSFLIYEMATGEIVRFYQGPSEMLPFYISDTQTYIEGEANTETQYVNLETKQITLRPQLHPEIVDLTIKGVPAGGIITIDNVDYNTDGTDIELEFDLPGKYYIVVKCFPYLRWSATVEVKSQSELPGETEGGLSGSITPT